jgi:hypothetical protein
MSRSRFENLEPERGGDAEEPARSLERFGADPAPAEPAVEAPADRFRPPERPAALARFEADGSEGLGLELGDLKDMPTLRCPGCQAECSKYSTQCHVCGASLESPEALAVNDALHSERRAERAAAAQAVADRRDAELAAIDQASDEADADEPVPWWRALPPWVWWVLGVISVSIAVLLPWWPVKLVAVVVVLVLAARRQLSVWDD